MRAFSLMLAAVVCLSGQAAEKKAASNADKIVGKWEVTKGEGVPAGAIVEFTKDGKLKVTAEIDGKTLNLEGTYKVEGNKITTTLKEDGQEKTETSTIKTLTAKELSVEDGKGKEVSLKKKK